MNSRETIVEAVRQMVDGMDYDPLVHLVSDLSAEQAVCKLPGAVYSIATVAWHAWFWNRVWLRAIRGEGDPFGGHDPDNTWPEVTAEDWPETRDQLLESLRLATELAKQADLEKTTWETLTVGHNLLQIAMHTAYHIGQIALLRQQMNL